MQDNARKITYGAMMIALFAILLTVSIYVPFIGSVTMLFIPLPIILYRLRYNRASSVLVTAAGVMLSLFVGGLLLIPFAIVCGLLGLVIGDTVKTGKTKLFTFMATGLTLLITGMILYVGAVLLFSFNIIDTLFKDLQEMQDQMASTMASFGGLPKNYDQLVQSTFTFYESTLPSIFIIGAFVLAFIIVIPNLAIVQRLGHDVPRFPPFSGLKLPVFTVIIYGVIVLISLFATMEPGSNLYMITINATLILRTLFLLQGLSLIIYYMKEMKLPKAVTVISLAVALLFSPMTTLLGILDTGVNIRSWIGKDKAK